MTRWEYRKIDLSRVEPKLDDIELLNDAGHEGWELLAIVANNIAYLKRCIQVATTVQQISAPASKRGTARAD